VVIIAAIALLGIGFLLRPDPPPDRPPPNAAQRLEFRTRAAEILTRSLISVVMVGSVLGIAAGVWMSRRLTAPLEELAKGTETIGAGDLSYRVKPQGSAEIVALAQSFNGMAGKLEEGERLRQNLLTDVAHELRTPLTVLQGNLRAILDDVYALDKAEVAHLYDQTRHLHRLVSDLHELAQAEARQLPLNLQTTDLVWLVEDAVAIFAPIAEAEELQLQVNLPKIPVMVQVDQARITQVLQNLLVNALRHTPAGGCITVRLTVDEVVKLIIQDTGEGIDAEHLPYLFDRFYRTDNARDRDHGGAGLGLAIVRALVEAHEGQVAVASAGRGQGSTFTITLPGQSQL
jgi:signal transduction histidine kinase